MNVAILIFSRLLSSRTRTVRSRPLELVYFKTLIPGSPKIFAKDSKMFYPQVNPPNCLLAVQLNAAGPLSIIWISEKPPLRSYLTTVTLSRQQLSTGRSLPAAPKTTGALLVKLGLNLLNPTREAYIPILEVTMQSQSGGHVDSDMKHHIIFILLVGHQYYLLANSANIFNRADHSLDPYSPHVWERKNYMC
jgi:hypothetical protein